MRAWWSATEWMGIITMKANNFGYLLKEGVRGLFLHGFMSFAAICVTVACLLIMGSFSLVIYNVNIMVEDLDQENEILVYVDESLSEAEAKSVGSNINLIANVHEAVFVSREEALESFIANQGGDPAFAGVEASTFRHRFIVTLEDNSIMKETVEQIKLIPGVADISAHYEIAEGLTTLQKVLQIVSLAVIIVLLVVSLLIISNTVKLAMYDRRDEIAIMKMVGATNGFIRIPFVVEGFLLGAISAVVSFFMQWGLYDYLKNSINSVDALGLFDLISFHSVLYPMIAVFAAAGFFVGVIGSLMSIRKFMDV